MGILKIKQLIISTTIGRFFDSRLRRLLAFIPFLHSNISQKNISFIPENFIFFLYGGIGDNILLFPLINKLSQHSKVIVLCEKTISNLSFLFLENIDVVIYDKNHMIKQGISFRKELVKKNSVFVQTSPIIEVYFIRCLLGLNYSIGLSSDFLKISSIGFKSKNRILKNSSRFDSYLEIYKDICYIFYHSAPPVTKGDFLTLPDFDKNINGYNGNYVVISALKSAQWEMGKMPDSEYRNLAEKIIEKFGYKVFFVGDISEFQVIDQIISKSIHKKMITNMAGKTTFSELVSVLHNAKFIVSNDNGISHLSSFLGLKTLVLFMFSDPSVYAWPNKNYAYILNDLHPCMPCVGVNQYPQDNYPVICKYGLVCNKTIVAEQIIHKINSLSWV